MTMRLDVGNLSNVSDSFPVIPEGVYEAQVEEMKLETSKTGNPLLSMKLNVVNNADHMGVALFDRISLQAKALWRLKQFCKAAGLAWDDGGVDVEPARGSVVLVKVIQELYTPEGKEPRLTNKIDAYVERV